MYFSIKSLQATAERVVLGMPVNKMLASFASPSCVSCFTTKDSPRRAKSHEVVLINSGNNAFQNISGNPCSYKRAARHVARTIIDWSVLQKDVGARPNTRRMQHGPPMEVASICAMRLDLHGSNIFLKHRAIDYSSSHVECSTLARKWIPQNILKRIGL